MAIFGDTLGDLSRNQLAFRLANDARTNAIANQLAAAADRASRERMVNRDVDAQNFRWLNPNATAQAELASRERMWAAPSGNQLAANANNLTIAEMPWVRGETAAQQKAREGAERNAMENRRLQEMMWRDVSGDAAARNQLMRDHPELFNQNGYASGRIALNDYERNNLLNAARSEAQRRLNAMTNSDKAVEEVAGMLDKGPGPWYKFNGDLDWFGDTTGTARKIVAGEDFSKAKDKNPTAYAISELWKKRKEQYANQVLDQMIADQLYNGGISYNPTNNSFFVGAPTSPVTPGSNPTTAPPDGSITIGGFKVTPVQ